MYTQGFTRPDSTEMLGVEPPDLVPGGEASNASLRVFRTATYLRLTSTRRLAAQASSLWPSTAGRLNPYPIVSMLLPGTPRSERYFLTVAARRLERWRLY